MALEFQVIFDCADPGLMDAGHIVMQDPEGNEFCLD